MASALYHTLIHHTLYSIHCTPHHTPYTATPIHPYTPTLLLHCPLITPGEKWYALGGLVLCVLSLAMYTYLQFNTESDEREERVQSLRKAMIESGSMTLRYSL